MFYLFFKNKNVKNAFNNSGQHVLVSTQDKDSANINRMSHFPKCQCGEIQTISHISRS